jgi:ABC-type glycerol-3-phosphate transport system substrate-binding protein
MKDIKPIQFIVIFASVALAIIGIMVFAFLGPKAKKSDITGTAIVWGTIPRVHMDSTINAIYEENRKKSSSSKLPLNFKYTEKNPANIRTELLEAIAQGSGPDLVILSSDQLLQNNNILLKVGVESYPERTFQDTFIDQGSMFKMNKGYFAFPFALDPLIMYYNKTTLTQADIVNPPQYWDEVLSLLPRLTTKDSNFRITKSAIGLGEYRNIVNSKEILSSLIVQSGGSITELYFDSANQIDRLKSSLMVSPQGENSLVPSIAALNFYTQFADATKSSTYTWSRSLPNSQEFFTAGNLAMYLGFGSERKSIEDKNPNLNYDISFIPQERSNNIKSTYGKLYGISILKTSKDTRTAFQVLNTLTSSNFLSKFVSYSNFAPVRRDLLNNPPPNVFSPVLYESALKSKGWLDPNPEATNRIFQNMIESVISGRSMPTESVNRANLELEELVKIIK